MERFDKELKSALTGQQIDSVDDHKQLLEDAMSKARCFSELTESIAVLSDFSKGNCHTFAGRFGQQVFSLAEYTLCETSPFEDDILNGIMKDDLLERHILELRQFKFIQSLPIGERTKYQMSCVIRFVKPDGTLLPVLHTSRYIHCDSKGNVWLGLCTYLPLPTTRNVYDRGIVNAITGQTVPDQEYMECDSKLLSKRQAEILALLAKGEGSKQIADRLNISVHTVNRHRQDILAALKVTNTASAVEIALRLNLI